MVATANTRVTLGVIIGSRGFFNAAYAQTARTDILAELEAMGVDHRILPFEATPNGAVETMSDARRYADFFDQHHRDIDGLLISLPNFGDEIAVVETIKRSGLKVPILLQAYDDQTDKVDVKGRRDAYCGKISVTNNLYQYGVPWTDTTHHTEDVATETFRADLRRFVGVCRVVRGVRTARIGAIGARPAPFQTMRFSEKLLERYGVTVVPVDLSVIMAAARAYADSDTEIQETVARIRDYGTIPAHVKPERVLLQAKWTAAVERWIAENECSASAIQCWDSLQKNYGCATCVTMSMMGERLRPSACEVDVVGALSMLVLSLAAEHPAGILDWNNNYGEARDMVVATHCSNYPKSFMGRAVEIGELDILGETLGREVSFGAIKGHVAAGPMTFFRATTDDRRGMVRSYVGEGEFTDAPFDMDGGIAVCRVARQRELMSYVTSQGFEHHVAMVRGNVGAIVEEAVGKYLGWDIMVHR